MKPSALFLLFALFSVSALAQSARPSLIPEPREYSPRVDLPLVNGVNVDAPGGNEDDRFAAEDLGSAFTSRGVNAHTSATAVQVLLLRDTSARGKKLLQDHHLAINAAMRPEGYILFTEPHHVYIIGHTAQGLFYGAQTAKQLISWSSSELIFKGCTIQDWPAMKWRGVHDDLSRGPVPTLNFQKKQIRTFAAYKLNVYSPYFENTLQYNSNPLPGLPGGSMSQQDVKELVEYAKHYHVTIVPEQEAFGHLHRWLEWQQYANLGETQAGSVLAPGQPGSMRLITQTFGELAMLFPGPFLHIGADETFELGRGQTASEVKQRGLGAVYIDFLTRIHAELAPLHRRLLFWGDVAMNDPPLVKNLPKDMIAVAWHYEPEPDFSRWLSPYTNAGMETWVAPGVNNWNRVYPNFDTALRNTQGFVAAGQKAGSTGMLDTIWNDDGEGLFLEDWYGVLFGAAASWQSGTSDIAQYQKAYGLVFHGDQTGAINQAQQLMINAHLTLAKAGLEDGRDLLFWVDPWSKDGQRIADKIRPVIPQVRLDAERAITLLAQARHGTDLRQQDALAALELGARRMDFLAFKFLTADQIADTYRQLYREQNNPTLHSAVSRDLWTISGVNGRCQDIREGYGYLKDDFASVWLLENRPYWLNNVIAQYEAAMQLWIERGEKLRQARAGWAADHKLPPPQEIGIPD
ncbi:family 20 glycosylhydrolase [Acidipila rosea]|uniref:beta-N-acetylhexosaminidase n=1 Tax=Acidipila rosea TaxID=768535 RepID=A0A4R1L093_9BACT|nr:family 20 glycosylhydrolase [Acidipila rosea]TCK70233.1 glycosyl hydrolase family 20 [Acidipila rosea]